MRKNIFCNITADTNIANSSNEKIYSIGNVCTDDNLNKFFKEVQNAAFPEIRSYYKLRVTDKFNNAMAHFEAKDNENLERVITINPNFFRNFGWLESEQRALLAYALAHELAHHQLLHTDKDYENVCNNLIAEIEADDRAGYAIAKLIPSIGIDFFESFLPKIITNIENVNSHPGLKYRLMAIKGGWLEGKQGYNDTKIYKITNSTNTFCKMIYTDKEVYFGGLDKDNKETGEGIFFTRKNVDDMSFIYFGGFKDRNFHGDKCLFYWENGTKYIGEVKDGARTGKGVSYYKGGYRYEGYFQEGLFSGKGIYYYSDGTRYEGDFFENYFEGNGSKYYPDGRLYKGQFHKDLYEGYGTYQQKDGTIYRGFFKNGKEHGYGYLYKGETLIKWGCWENGKYIGIECKE